MEVLIRVRIVGRAADERPSAEQGYKVVTNRGSVAYVDPPDIFILLSEALNGN